MFLLFKRFNSFADFVKIWIHPPVYHLNAMLYTFQIVRIKKEVMVYTQIVAVSLYCNTEL